MKLIFNAELKSKYPRALDPKKLKGYLVKLKFLAYSPLYDVFVNLR